MHDTNVQQVPSRVKLICTLYYLPCNFFLYESIPEFHMNHFLPFLCINELSDSDSIIMQLHVVFIFD